MATTNDALATKIDGLAKLLQMFREDQTNQYQSICSQLESMNGRQRENTAAIADNERDIATLRVYVDQSTTRKATFVGILGFIEAIGAFIGGMMWKP